MQIRSMACADSKDDSLRRAPNMFEMMSLPLRPKEMTLSMILRVSQEASLNKDT